MSFSKDLLFMAPINADLSDKPKTAIRIVDGVTYLRSPSIWVTNLDHGRRHQKLTLMTMADNLKFNKKMKGKVTYNKYDNYDAIEVPFTDAIPSDYKGVMGVPITFLNKYNPDQFEVVSSNDVRLNDGVPFKEHGLIKDKDAAKRLINNEKIQDVLGRKPIVTILKPNSLAKNLFEKDPQKRAHYNEYICNLHRNTLIELTSFNPRPNVDFVYTDVALFDRGPYDDIFWSYALKEADLIDDIEKDDALKISARSVRDKLIDIVFGINVPPATSLRREEKRGEGYGNVMNPEFLPIIHAIYMKAEREEKLRIGLFSLYKEGRITESDYSDQTKGFLIRQTRYISVNGEDSKEINSDKFFNPLRGQLLYNHGVSEELEHLLEKSA